MAKKRKNKNQAKNQNEISRRMFLKGVGGASLVIPVLPSLLPKAAWAQNQVPLKRYFSLVGGFGIGHPTHWYPTLSQLPLVGNSGNGDLTYRYQTLSSFINSPTDELSLILSRQLNPYINKMNIIRGLNLHTRIGHGRGHMLGNIAATDGHDSTVTALKALPTIDQVLAANRNFTPHSLDPLNMGNSYSYQQNSQGQVSRASGRWTKPHSLFSSLFTINGSPLPENGSGSTPAHPRTDILTRVFEDYRRVRRGRQISSVDAQVLDEAMDRYSDIISRIGNTGNTASGCGYSHINASQTQNDGVGSGYDYDPERHAYAFELYARIFAAAASCDLHRVFNLHLHIPGHFDRHPSEDFHQGHSHLPWEVIASNGNRVNHQYLGEIRRMYIESFLVPLLRELDASNDSNGLTMLDNSLVHVTFENSTVHSDYSKPCLLVGGAGGDLTTGHFIDYSKRDLGPHPQQGDGFSADSSDPRFGHVYYGAHYNRSLTTILRALGLSPSDYEDPEINRFFQARTDGRIGAHNNGIANVGGYGHIGAETSGVWYYTNEQLYSEQYAHYNYHFYKNSLPFPVRSAS